MSVWMAMNKPHAKSEVPKPAGVSGDTFAKESTKAVDNGSWRQWDRIWKNSIGTDEECLYVRGRPRRRRQLVMQCYFDDLWSLCGPNPESMKFLELGAGRGTISMYITAKGADVSLVDMSSDGLELAKKHFQLSGLSVPRTMVADATATNLSGSQYDCIFNIGLLEHFIDPLPLLRESVRLLRPGGLLFQVIVPKVPVSRAWPIQFTLNPLMTSYRASRQVISMLLKRSRTTTGMVRDRLFVRTVVRVDVSCRRNSGKMYSVQPLPPSLCKSIFGRRDYRPFVLASPPCSPANVSSVTLNYFTDCVCAVAVLYQRLVSCRTNVQRSWVAVKPRTSNRKCSPFVRLRVSI